MHKKRAFVFIALVVVVGLTIWFLQLLPAYDTNRVEPRLLALKQPYQNVKTDFFWDGGSVAIEIVDRDGKHEQFAIPNRLEDTNRLAKVFVGAIYCNRSGAIEVADSEQTKRMLIHILAAKQGRTPGEDYCLMELARRPVDFVRCLIHKWRGDYKM